MQAQSGNSDVVPRGGAMEAVESRSGVSWGAVFAGAAAAAALSLVLFSLGTGLGLASISPWSYNSAAAIGISTILWISFTQLAASAAGGYMAGRLRTKWASLHTDEVYFRDTAHGLLAWAMATLLTAMLVGGAVTPHDVGNFKGRPGICGYGSVQEGAAKSQRGDKLGKFPGMLWLIVGIEHCVQTLSAFDIKVDANTLRFIPTGRNYLSC